MNIGRPDSTEYSPSYSGYVARAAEDDVVEALEKQRESTRKVLAGIDEKKAQYRYEPGKWSIKELVGHIADSERVFAYRAMCIARGEKQSLPGFDEKEYVQASGFAALTLGELAENLSAVRAATLTLFRTLPSGAWQIRGTANDTAVTVRAIPYIILGHERHHLNVLKEKYGV